jgi:aarF domain-containing kinase
LFPDALTVLNDIPFTIPPYFALLGRAIVTLEGVALSGDPDYAIIRQSYPFVARKLMREGRPEIQKALQEVLYAKDSSGSAGLKLTRLLALLNNAVGQVATKEGAVFVDLDQVPENGLSLGDGIKYLLSDDSEGLRNLLEKEVDTIVDVISRQVFRRGIFEAMVAMAPPRPPALPFLGDIFPATPAFDQVPLPILLPNVRSDGSLSSAPSVGILSLSELVDVIAPKLTQVEEIYAVGLGQAATEFFGREIGDMVQGDKLLTPRTALIVLQALRSGVLGRTNELLSSTAAKSVLQFLGDSLQAVVRGNAASSEESALFGKDVTGALESLDASEKARFDDIVEQLIQRAMDRLVQRLAVVNRVV